MECIEWNLNHCPVNYKCDKYNQSIPRTTAEGEQIDGHVVGREMGQAARLPVLGHGSSSSMDFSHGGIPDLHQRADSIPHLLCNPSSPSVPPSALKKGRIHAKKKAWLLEVLSSWSIFHLLSLNYFLSVRVYRYHCSLPEVSVVQSFKAHRFP